MKSKKRISTIALFVAMSLCLSMVASSATYVVKSGDMLWKIAKNLGYTYQELAEVNAIKNPNLIYPGQVIKTPEAQSITPDAPARKGTFISGTYEGKGKGMIGDVVMTVTFNEEAITDVVVKSHSETVGISDPAFAKLPKSILTAQSTKIDTVSGATMTSKGILAAVEAAIKKAGADPSALRPIATKPESSVGTTKNADVVVVGGGLAGLSAAIKATQGGASVILIEKLAAVGGSSAMSGGGLGATGSSLQKEYGIEDSDAAWKALWVERQATSPVQGKYPDWALVDRLIAYSSTSIEWLRSLNYEMRKPEGFGVDPALRLHFPAPTGSGSVLIKFLENKAKELGVEIMLETKGTELISTNGTVTGVKATEKNSTVTLHSKAVILASGGFAKSKELLARFTPEVEDYLEYSTVGAGSTGDGILMAEAVGAVPYENPWMIGLGVRTPAAKLNNMYWLGNHIYVNQEAQRFTNEAGHYAIVYNDAVYSSKGGSYMVFDSGAAYKNHVASAEAEAHEAIVKADTIEALAQKLKLDPEALQATIATYNANAKDGKDAFGKVTTLCPPIETAPFYGVAFYPCAMGTFGGVKVGSDWDVLSVSGKPISGLYAAGEMANKPFYSQVYMSGSALQVASSTGQWAGEAAAKYAQK